MDLKSQLMLGAKSASEIFAGNGDAATDPMRVYLHGNVTTECGGRALQAWKEFKVLCSCCMTCVWN